MKMEIRDATGGQYYWRIVAANGQVLAHSESYVSKAGCLDAIRSVKVNAATASVLDLTSSALASAAGRALRR